MLGLQCVRSSIGILAALRLKTWVVGVSLDQMDVEDILLLIIYI